MGKGGALPPSRRFHQAGRVCPVPSSSPADSYKVSLALGAPHTHSGGQGDTLSERTALWDRFDHPARLVVREMRDVRQYGTMEGWRREYDGATSRMGTRPVPHSDHGSSNNNLAPS